MNIIAAGFSGAFALVVAAIPCAAQDCPTAETVKRGFTVEQRAVTQLEVQHVDETLVQTTLRSGNSVLMQSVLFQGLFELDHLEGGRRATFRPKVYLAVLFPLRANSQLSAEFEVDRSGQTRTVKHLLAVKDAARFEIGPCTFDIFNIDRSQAAGDGAPKFVHRELYAPLLKLVVAKEYKNADGSVTRRQYNRIYWR